MFVDAHCHIDLHPDPQRILELAVRSRLRVIAVTTTPAAFKGSVRYTDFENGVLPALGMHPELVGTRKSDMSQFAKYLDQVSWVGEVGLDGSARFRSSWADQLLVFEQILDECTQAGGKVLSIHSRASATSVLDLLQNKPSAGSFVFHWFSGSLKELDRALGMDCYFSINDQMLSSKSGTAIAKRIPLERLLTESDAPFLQGKDHQSLAERIESTVNQLAEVKGSSAAKLCDQITENFSTLSLRYTRKSDG
jgi:TatD DNase family protein